MARSTPRGPTGARPQTDGPRVAGGAGPTRSWDTFAATSPLPRVWLVLGLLVMIPGLVASYLRVRPPTDDAPALVASFISYGTLAYALSLALFTAAVLRARRRLGPIVLASVSAVLLACHLCWLAPLFIPDHRVATTPSFTLLSLNLRHGAADSSAVAQQAARADVVVFLEATPTAVSNLEPYGWTRRFPYSAGALTEGAGDTVLFSRYPLTEKQTTQQPPVQQSVATVTVPGIGPLRIIAAHPCNPYCGHNLWHSEHEALRQTAEANLDRPLILAGDLNAVDDHGPIRELRRDGLESVTDIVGAGWLPTYPANRTIPPLLPIDHILVNHYLTATSVTRFTVPGTDHLGLLAQIAGTG